MPFTWSMTIDNTTDWTNTAFIQMFIDACYERLRLCPGIPPNGGTNTSMTAVAPTDPAYPGANKYYYYITAIMPDGETPYSTAGNVTLPDGSAWTKFTGFAVPGTSLGFLNDVTEYHDVYGCQLSWIAVSGAHNYRIYRATGPTPPDFSTSFPSLLASVSGLLTAWQDNGNWDVVANPNTAGTSSTLAMAAPAVTASLIKTVNAQPGDDVQASSAISSYHSEVSPRISAVAVMQELLQDMLPYFCDPTAADSTAAINRGMLDAPSSGPYATVIEQLTAMHLWRRMRPRQVHEDVILQTTNKPVWWQTGFRCMVTPADDAALAGNSDYITYFRGPPGGMQGTPGTVHGEWLTFIYDGTNWNYATLSDGVTPNFSAQPDILDSEDTSHSGGFHISPGFVTFGDMLGPWLFNQIRTIINLMIWTFDRPQLISPGDYQPNLTILCHPSDSLVASYEYKPGSEEALVGSTDNEYIQQAGFGTGSTLTAAYTAAVAALGALTNESFPSASQLGQFSDQGPGSPSTRYDVWLTNISFKLVLYPICLKYNSTTDFLLATYTVTDLSDPTNSSQRDPSWGLPLYSPPFIYAIFDTVTQAAVGDKLGAIISTATFNPSLASVSQQAPPVYTTTTTNLFYGVEIFPPASVTKWSGLTFHA